MVSRWILRAALAAASVVAGACDLTNPGDAPPPDKLYFPTALALSSDGCLGATDCTPAPPRLLYVGNDNFDLRYNSGNLQAFDLDEIDARLQKCAGSSDCAIEPADVLVDELLVGTFVSTIGRGVRPGIKAGDDPRYDGRVYVATRTDRALQYIDVDERAPRHESSKTAADVFDCGQGDGRRCDDAYLRGDEDVANERRLSWPGEPVALLVTGESDWDPALQPMEGDDDAGVEPLDGGMGAGDAGPVTSTGEPRVVLIAHRAGAVSLFVDTPDHGPQLAHVISGLRPDLTSIAYDRQTTTAFLTYNDRSALTTSKVLLRLGISLNMANPGDSFLFQRSAVQLSGVALTADTRAISFFESAGLEHLGGRALVVARRPDSLMVVDVDQERSIGPVRRITEVGDGPSRLTQARVDGRLIAAVSCFNAREIHIIDVASGHTLSVVPNLSGPFELILDGPRKRLYVADFRSSIIRIFDLTRAVSPDGTEGSEARQLGTLGRPQIVQELQ